MLRNEIEKQLQSIGSAEFQILMDEFLPYIRNITFKSSPGTKEGANKTTKGQPDSFFINNNNNTLIFAEYTTQQKNIIKKLKDDINSCINLKTDAVELSEIILAFTSKISNEDYQNLNKYAHNINPNIKLTVYSIQEIAQKLQLFPNLKDYFPTLPILEGITTLNGFIKEQKEGFRPNLENPYIKCKSHEECINLLYENKYMIIHGNQGIGKSRLTLEIGKTFKDKGFNILVITHYNNNLKNNLSRLFKKNENYLVIIDNYTEDFKNIEETVKFLDELTSINIKLIFSVKSQFFKKLKIHLNNFNIVSYKLDKFSPEEINKIITSYLKKNNLSMKNQPKQKLIEISKGNPNLVMMALYSAVKYENMNYLENPIKIYDKYYEDFIKVKNFSINDHELIILGIISFFGVLDKRDTELNQILTELFNFQLINEWETIRKLNTLELIDIYENTLVKLSDDVLKNYTFYKVFLKDNPLLDFEILLDHFIIRYIDNFKNILYDLYNLFNYKNLENIFIPKIKTFKQKYGKNHSLILPFYELFHIFYEKDTLNFIKEWSNNLKIEEYNFNDFKIPENKNNFNYTPEISLLKIFYEIPAFMEFSLHLSLNIIKKQPSKTLEIVENINDAFKFKLKNIENKNFDIQINLINFLAEKEDTTTNIIKKQIFIEIAPKLLQWHNVDETYHNMTITFQRFNLINCLSLRKLRSKILKRLFELSEDNLIEFKHIFNTYINVLFENNKEIYLNEEKIIYDFFINTKQNYIYSSLIYKYLQKFKEYFDPSYEFEILYNNDEITIGKIYTTDFGYHKDSMQLIENDLKDKSKKDILNILNILKEIGNMDKNLINNYPQSIDHVFEVLVKKDIDLFKDIFIYYLNNLDSNIKTYINSHFIYVAFNEKLINPIDFYKINNITMHYNQNYFNESIFRFSPSDSVNKELFFKLITFLNSTKNFNTYQLKEYEKFNKYYIKYKNEISESNNCANIIQYITRLLLNKKEVTFDNDFCKDNILYFEDNINLLKKIYFKTLKNNTKYDYNQSELKSLCSKDYSIIKEYLNFIDFKDICEEDIDLSFIWNLNIPEYYLNDIIESITEKSNAIDNYFNILFKGLNEEDILYKLIKQNKNSEKHITLLFNMILTKFNEEEFIEYLQFFLKINNNITLFKSIPLKKHFSIIGDLSYYYNNQISFYNKILNMLNSLTEPSNPLKYHLHETYLQELIENEKETLKNYEYYAFKEIF